MSMTVIEHIELTSAESNITFSSIPTDGTYTDLYLVMQLAQGVRNAPNGGMVFTMKFNGSSSNYTSRTLRGSGSAILNQSLTYLQVYGSASDTTANTFGNSLAYIPNYASSNYKSVSFDLSQETNATTAYHGIEAGLWSDTSPINSISLQTLFGESLSAGCSATLYGITAGSDGTTTIS